MPSTFHRRCLTLAAGAFLTAAAATAGTFGNVVSIGGQAADLALDETRGVLYIANFTANRIDVMTLRDNTVHTSINVAAQPSSLSMSLDGHWLAIAHYGNNTAPASPNNVLSLIDLTNNNALQTFSLGSPPLGVVFGSDNRALVVTTTSFLLFDPSSGALTTLKTMAEVANQTLPQPLATFPGSITQANLAASGDGTHVFGIAGQVFLFRYDVLTQALVAYTITLPFPGPRAVSVNQDGSLASVAWGIFGPDFGTLAQFPNTPVGLFSLGTSVLDSSRQLVYAQMPSQSATATVNTAPPLLQIADWDNLTIEETLQLPENFTGKSVLSNDFSTLYGVSDSGVMVLPVGSLNSAPRVAAGAEDLIFRGNFCDRTVASQTLTIADPGGNHTPFSITPSAAGVTVSPSSGVTPAVVTVSVDPNVFQGKTGTSVVALTVTSAAAVNVPNPVRVLINSEEPNQRGSIVDVPGTIVDVLADPKRPQYYVLRQDKNQVLVFNGVNNTQMAVLRTCTTPKGMAITYDQQSLLIGCDNAQRIWSYDLDSFQSGSPIVTTGMYVQSLAASSNVILAQMRAPAQAGPGLALVDPVGLTATFLPSLGIYQNTLALDTVLTSSLNGSKILIASADGNTLLYDSNANTFTASRRDFGSLGGAYAASAFDQFVIGNNLLNSSLTPVGQLGTANAAFSGFAFATPSALGTVAVDSASPGMIQRVDVTSGTSTQPTPMIEAPLLGQAQAAGGTGTCTTVTTGNTSTQTCVNGTTVQITVCTTSTSGSTTTQTCNTQTSQTATSSPSAFTRTLAVLFDQSEIISTTTSGFTVLPWTFDTGVAVPTVASVVSAADSSSPVAPGGLITIYGSQLSSTNQATQQIPFPTVLANSCITVNDQPIPMLFVSPAQVNAQLPFEASGDAAVVVHTPGGLSDGFSVAVQPTAPAVFLSASAGPLTNLPTILRASTGLLVTDSNPVHRGDTLVIYLTGMGTVSPAVGDGDAAPGHPLAAVMAPPSVTLGNVGLPVLYAGLSPGEVGVYQINVQVPNNTPQGLSVPLVISQGGAAGTLNLRVVQ